MRIISGTARGTKLFTLEGQTTRPTLDRVKESIFNIIQSQIINSNFLDVFSGSGAIGLEAASRGAKKVILCDKSKDAINIINKNIEKTHLKEKIELYNLDYEGENFMNLLFDMSLKKDAIGNCLSTSVRTNGAVAVFLPGVAQRLGKLIGGSFYMVFTSIHEVMIHSEDSADPRKLKEVLAETVEETTPEEDFLTYYVYHYNAETGQFSYY